MAGVSQVWLTAEELEDTAAALEYATVHHTPALLSALAKIERALAPVACGTASGSKSP